MGCFSYMCKMCGEPVLSNSNRGELVTLYLLVNGKIHQEMTGEYDSYGKVFKEDLKSSHQWVTMEWGDMITLHFDENPSNGIAAIHKKCHRDGMLPTTRSEDDPNQGWGKEGEFFEDLDEGYDFNN